MLCVKKWVQDCFCFKQLPMRYSKKKGTWDVWLCLSLKKVEGQIFEGKDISDQVLFICRGKKSKFLFLSLKFCYGRNSVGLTSHRGLSTLTKYHWEAASLQEFSHHSDISSFMFYFSYKIGPCFAFFHVKSTETFESFTKICISSEVIYYEWLLMKSTL